MPRSSLDMYASSCNASDCLLHPHASLSLVAFEGATLFITGATGFLGSVVLEQLLRLCQAVKKVYLLIRVKGGQSGRERLEQLLRKQLFHLHWEDCSALPEALLAKVVAVAGDTSAPGLGLSDTDRCRLVSEVDTVIHCAASISFFDHIHTLLTQNYEATRATAKLASTMPNLRAFVYVSTAYVNAHLPRGSHVEERIYPLHHSDGSRVQHAALAAALLALPPGRAARQAAGVLRAAGLPNCYTLTKHMAEELVAGMHCAAFPAAIVRPTIIGAVAKAPLPGYFGNAAGITSATLAFASGLARFSCHDPHNVYDVIPCDLTASAVLAAALALRQGAVAAAPEPLVVHSGSSCTNPVKWFDAFSRTIFPYWDRNPPPANRRLTTKRYKPTDHPTAFLPEHTLAFQAMTLKHALRFKAMAAGLRVAGHGKAARLLSSSWKVWKLYNTTSMDFHLYFCARNLVAMQGAVKVSDQAALQMVWSKDEAWQPYLLTHMDAIRAKYYPSTVVESAALQLDAPERPDSCKC